LTTGAKSTKISHGNSPSFRNGHRSLLRPYLFGWVFGDIIALIIFGTIMTMAETPHLMRTVIYVREFFS
jgi:hypothetical protein